MKKLYREAIMPSPFPGTDPWLEDPAVFPDIHDRLVTYISDTLNTLLPSPYRANTATRVWVEVSQRRIGPDVKVLRPDGPARDRDGGGVAVADPVGVAPIVIHVSGDAPIVLGLQPLLDRVYDNGRYGGVLEYRKHQPQPPLTDAQREWAERILHEKGL